MIYKNRRLVSAAFFVAATISSLVSTATAAYPTYSPKCAALTDADFTATYLVQNSSNAETSEPLKMAFDMDAAGNVDVYFVQRFGLIRKYIASTKTTVNIGDFTSIVTTGGSDGVVGIALDPGFKTNKWIYLFYSNTDYKISRFTLVNDKIDMTSEKIMIHIKENVGSVHTGGAMQFDNEGNLWITVGENNAKWPSGNTSDLRGKILRIKPTPDGGYTIPAGNLFPVGTAKTKPEIYVMGARNPYSLTLDVGRHGMTWGDVGPDGKGSGDEHDFTTKPMNGGYPNWAGNQISIDGGGTPAAPTYTGPADPNALTNLPPAIAATNPTPQACAVTGPVYYYNPNSTYKGRMPPHFNGIWFVTDFSKKYIEALTLDAKGENITARSMVFTTLNPKIDGPLDFQVGPDGAFYVMNYAGYRTTKPTTGILKIEYNGTCSDPGFVTSVNKGNAFLRGVSITNSSIIISSYGAHFVTIRNLAGQIINEFAGQDGAQYNLNSIQKSGVYLIQVKTTNGSLASKIVRE